MLKPKKASEIEKTGEKTKTSNNIANMTCREKIQKLVKKTAE